MRDPEQPGNRYLSARTEHICMARNCCCCSWSHNLRTSARDLRELRRLEPFFEEQTTTTTLKLGHRPLLVLLVDKTLLSLSLVLRVRARRVACKLHRCSDFEPIRSSFPSVLAKPRIVTIEDSRSNPSSGDMPSRLRRGFKFSLPIYARHRFLWRRSIRA